MTNENIHALQAKAPLKFEAAVGGSVCWAPPDANPFEIRLNILATTLTDPSNHTRGSIGQHIQATRKLNTSVYNQDSSNTDRLAHLSVMLDKIIQKTAGRCECAHRKSQACGVLGGVNVSRTLNFF